MVLDLQAIFGMTPAEFGRAGISRLRARDAVFAKRLPGIDGLFDDS